MSKMISGLRTARDNVMANMSASILRELVASTLNIKATKIKLSGILPENFKVEACSTSGSMFSNKQDCAVYAFNPKQGLKLLENSLITENYDSNADGSWEHSYGYTYEMLAEQAPKAIFFLIYSMTDYSDNNRSEYDVSYTLYKAPNFQEYWNNIEAADIARWERWLSE